MARTTPLQQEVTMIFKPLNEKDIPIEKQIKNWSDVKWKTL